MNKKSMLSAVERLAQLRIIPKQKLPSTLRTPIQLQNISQIRLHYRPMCKNVGPSLQLVRTFGPNLRFYNPGLVIQKVQQPDGPLAMQMQVYLKNAKEPVVVEPNQFKTPEALLQKIKDINMIQ